jgi:inorganic pyrophosphatase
MANYLEILSVHRIAKNPGGKPRNAAAFTGFPKMHPGGKGKFILVSDPLGDEPVVLEFNTEDLLFAEEVPAAVTREGEGVPLVKIWVRKGAVGVILEPFEVQDPPQFKKKAENARRRFLRDAGKKGGSGDSSGR